MITKYEKIKKSSHGQSLFFSVFLAVLLIAIVGFLIAGNIMINQKRNGLELKMSSLQKEIQILEQKKKDLELKIVQSPEAENLEKEARERFDMKKPGEEVVVVLPQEKPNPPQKQEKNWWNPLNW